MKTLFTNRGQTLIPNVLLKMLWQANFSFYEKKIILIMTHLTYDEGTEVTCEDNPLLETLTEMSKKLVDKVVRRLVNKKVLIRGVSTGINTLRFNENWAEWNVPINYSRDLPPCFAETNADRINDLADMHFVSLTIMKINAENKYGTAQRKLLALNICQLDQSNGGYSVSINEDMTEWMAQVTRTLYIPSPSTPAPKLSLVSP